MSLKEKLAEFGFESNESYDHVVQCFLNSPGTGLPCLNVDGEDGRHKTAFAHALARALGHAHVLYHEFGLEEAAYVPVIRMLEGEPVVDEPPVAELDRTMNEACALSEAEKTVVILDQLQLADFKHHIRLRDFMGSGVWRYGDVSCYANKGNLQVYLVSDGGLDPMLQQVSFRVWLPLRERSIRRLSARDVDLPPSSEAWLPPLIELMDALSVSPSKAEYIQLAHDIEYYVRTEKQLKESIIGRVRYVVYERLHDEAVQSCIQRFMTALESSLFVQENIEISSDITD